ADVIEEVGKDACRFFFVSRSADSHMDFDLELAKKESNENPVYYVQYSHARTASILDLASERGVLAGDGAVRIEHPSEQALARALLRYPEIVYDAALQMEPHRLTYFAQELAGIFNAFYRDCRVLPSDRNPQDPPREVSESRLRLVAASKQVLANVLGIIGVSAPERMARLEEEGSDQ
ncbi:MAG TPA: DALR anticodon-binding domain-containing protein, partial [Chloroflexota bacterium]|nr:DALR anticodon-binding domain-containing protein [Chloroflexota bacterium]